jgi:hypothetical protein
LFWGQQFKTMTDNEKEFIGKSLEEVLSSDGGRILMAHIESEIKEGWDTFIDLPVAQKTSKNAFNYQAKYEVLRNLKDWITDQIKLGKQI